MALQYIDGFNHYHTTNDVGFTGGAAATKQKWDATFQGGEMFPVVGEGRFNDGNNTHKGMHIQASSGDSWIKKNLTTDRDEVVVGFACISKSAHQVEMRFEYTSGGWIELRLDYNAGTVAVVNNDVGVNVVTAAILSQDVWNYMELKVKVDATAGTYEVRIDGVDVLSGVAADTGTAGDVITAIRFRARNNLQDAFIDDLYVLDTTGATNNDFLGDVRVDVLIPKANGATNNFTLFDDGQATSSPMGATDNFLAVQNVGNLLIGRDHNYVESGLVGASEEYTNKTMADVGLTPSSILGVQIVNNAKKTSTGAIHYKNEMIIAGAAFDDGTTVVSTGGDYHMTTFIRDTDPSDSGAWTIAKVDAVGSGFSITFKET